MSLTCDRCHRFASELYPVETGCKGDTGNDEEGMVCLRCRVWLANVQFAIARNAKTHAGAPR